MYADIRHFENPDYVTRNLSRWETGRQRLSLPCERGLIVERSYKDSTTISHSRTSYIWFVAALLLKNRLILRGLFHPDYENTAIFRNVGHYCRNDTESHNKKNGIIIFGSQAVYTTHL
jgi:hypothetical protein